MVLSKSSRIVYKQPPTQFVSPRTGLAWRDVAEAVPQLGWHAFNRRGVWLGTLLLNTEVWIACFATFLQVSYTCIRSSTQQRLPIPNSANHSPPACLQADIRMWEGVGKRRERQHIRMWESVLSYLTHIAGAQLSNACQAAHPKRRQPLTTCTPTS